MQFLRNLIFVMIVSIGSLHTVFADDAALIEGVFRNHAEAVARAETLYKRSIAGGPVYQVAGQRASW